MWIKNKLSQSLYTTVDTRKINIQKCLILEESENKKKRKEKTN